MTKDVFSREFFKSRFYKIIMGFIICFWIINWIYIIWYRDTLAREGKSSPEFGLQAQAYLMILLFIAISAIALPSIMEAKQHLLASMNFFLEFIIILIYLGNIVIYFLNFDKFAVIAYSILAITLLISIFLLKADYFVKKSNKLSDMEDMHDTLISQLKNYSEDIMTIDGDDYINIILNGKIIALKIEPFELNIEEIIHFKCLVNNSRSKDSILKKILLYRDHGWQNKEDIKKFKLIAKNEYDIIVLTTKDYKSIEELVIFLNKISK